MPNDKYDAVMKEALASAPRGQVIYETIEVINPDASWTPRFVNQRANKMLPLEFGEDPVLFEASGIEVTLPPTGENGTQDLKLNLQNVDRRATEYIKEVFGSPAVTQIIFRAYLSTDLSEPKQTVLLTLKSAKATVSSMAILAGFPDSINQPFPSEYYTRERFPSLGN